MPKTITLSLDGVPGENDKIEKWVPLSKKKMTFHFSTVMATRGSSTLMSRSGAWTGSPGTHQSIGGGIPASAWRRGHLDLQWLPLQTGQGPGGAWGCLPGCPLLGHSLWKCPSFLQWYQTWDVRPCWGGTP
jgi:hypothetical protein